MKKRTYKFLGISILIVTLVVNLQYALFDYGLGSGNLGSQLMAQGATSTSTDITDQASDGTSTSAGGASAHCYTSTTYPCDYDGGGFGISCSFTGRYGDPKDCTDVGCGVIGVFFGSNHHCVLKKS